MRSAELSSSSMAPTTDAGLGLARQRPEGKRSWVMTEEVAADER